MSDTKPPKLSLYSRNFCLFCSRVTRAIKQLELDVDVKNIWRDKQALQELQSATGRTIVPVLRIESAQGETTWLSESSDIIAYLITSRSEHK